MKNARASDILLANGGMGPGFDALRLGLSLWVFSLHSYYLCGGMDAIGKFAAMPFHRLLITPALPMFFLVSGYLVTGSALRTKAFSTFLLFRAFRIIPALAVEVVLSAFVLGPWLTEKTLSEYFSSRIFYKYFLNILGRPQFVLPGLFEKNPFSVVNANLWTLKPEFYCYAFMSAMILSGIVFRRKVFSACCLLIVMGILVYQSRGGEVSNFFGLANWKVLFVAFALGCLSFHYNDRFVISGRYFAIAVFLAVPAVLYPPAIMFSFVGLAYIVVYIGTRKIFLPGFLRKGDYSYGIYLFGFPIQQTIIYFLPPEHRNWFTLMALGLPLTFGFAAISWRFIEKPALKLKGLFKLNAAAYLRALLRLRFRGSEAQASSPSVNAAGR